MAIKKVVCIMGKSACGKSTVINKLCENDTCHYVVSKTTRGIREDDPNDKYTHIFSSPEEFREDLAYGRIVATYVSPSHYINWTSDDLFVSDKINIYAIDPIAFNEWSKSNDGDYELYGIYIDIPEDVRKERMEKRGGIFEDEPHLDWDILCNNKTLSTQYNIIDGSNTPDYIYENILMILHYVKGWDID